MADLFDMGVEGTRVFRKFASPNDIQDLFAGKHHIWVPGQQGQQVKFFGGQIDGLPVNCHAPGSQINGNTIPLNVLRAHGIQNRAAFQDDCNPQHKFSGGKWFDHIVVCSQLQSANSIIFISTFRQNQDWNLRKAAYRLTNRKPI